MSGTAARATARSPRSVAQGSRWPEFAGARVGALRIVAPVRSRARRAPFVVVVTGLLSVGMIGLIITSTALQDQAFELTELTEQATALEVEQQRLQDQAAAAATPANVADAAVRLGMVPNANPVFLRLSDGTVIGVAEPAAPGTNVNGASQ